MWCKQKPTKTNFHVKKLSKLKKKRYDPTQILPNYERKKNYFKIKT